MDRIELKLPLSGCDPFPALSLGLTAEVRYLENFAPPSENFVLTVGSDDLDPASVNLARLRSFRHSIQGINLDYTDLDSIPDAAMDPWHGLVSKVFVEVTTDQLGRAGDRMIFDLLNVCEENSAAVHLRISDYIADWQSGVYRWLNQLAGYVDVVGLPQPLRPKDSIGSLAVASSVHSFLHELPANTDVSLLCFDKASVSSDGIMNKTRYWFGL